MTSGVRTALLNWWVMTLWAGDVKKYILIEKMYFAGQAIHFNNLFAKQDFKKWGFIFVE